MKRAILSAICLLVLVCITAVANAAGLVNSGAILTGLQYSSVAWGDYDKDGDLDLAIAGSTGSTRVTKIYRNDSGTFTDIGAAITGVQEGCLAWGDFDNDGDLDLAVTGWTGTGYSSKIYRNNNGTFVDIAAGLTGLRYSSLAWGDYDNDGDLDLAICGYNGSAYATKIYRNDAGTFTDVLAGLTGIDRGSLAWGDYDNDGDLDLVAVGFTGAAYTGKIYRNDGGVFVDIGANLIGTRDSAVAWGDYDNDGDLDLAIAGYDGVSASVTKIYRNNGGVFTDIGAGLTGVRYGSLAWGDYDNDGDPDLLVSGDTGAAYITKIYRNDGGTFTDSSSGLTGLRYCSAAWGDYDNDGDLDLAIAGSTGTINTSLIYRNDCSTPNTAPTAPTGLSLSLTSSQLMFNWNASSDAETPAAGLSYNLRIGSTPGGNEVFSGTVSPASPAVGNAQKRLSWGLKGVFQNTLFWSVQAVDAAFARSPWANEQSGEQCVISGHIRDGAGAAVSSVTLTPSGGGASVTTDSTGFYLLHVAPGWTGVLAAVKAGYVLTPPSRSYTNAVANRSDQDYLANKWFTDSGATLTGVKEGSLAWGDYDNDGDLDLTIAGAVEGNPYVVTKLYSNQAGAFTEVPMGLSGVFASAMAWGDYDNDGSLDLAVAGCGTPCCDFRIYHNTGGNLTDIYPGLTGVCYSSLAWGDFDNDGDMDLALTGNNDFPPRHLTNIYRNDGGVFNDIGANLPGFVNCSIAWGDYDNDGDLDFALAGNGPFGRTTTIYRNDAGTFVDAGAGIMALADASLAWGDYDADGDLDLAISGQDISNVAHTEIYRNDGGVFTNIGAGLTGVCYSSLAWGDYDNDGDLDLAVAGDTRKVPACVSKIYRNDNGVFVDTGAEIVGVKNCALAWGDYDGDGDLDLAIAGDNGTTGVTKIYRNNCNVVNTAPSAPTGLSSSLSASGVAFSWMAASDAQTPVGGLSYNLRIGTSPGGADIYSGMADLSTGLRRVPAIGSAQKNLSWTLRNPVPGRIYWSVQAIDSGFAGSPWAPENDILVTACAISGRVTNSVGDGIQSVIISAGPAGPNATTGADGSYTLWVMPGWSGNLTASKQAFGFTPAGLSYSNVTTDVTNQNYSTTRGFSAVDIGLPAMYQDCIAAGDFDNDGDLDLAIAGLTDSGYITRIYRNDGGAFTAVADLKGVMYGALAWGDYDNDGDLDLAVSGSVGSSDITKIYRNDGGLFTDIGAGLPGTEQGSLSWGDYDNDGDLDLAISGFSDGNPSYLTRVYRNDGGVFHDISAGLIGVGGSSIAWGDYDGDGDLDLAVAGYIMLSDQTTMSVAEIYRNDCGVFTNIQANLSAPEEPSLAWGDYDNDGQLDLAIAGYGTSGYVCKIYHNSGGVFTENISALPAGPGCTPVWGDYDNDGDLDLSLTQSGDMGYAIKVYRNDNGHFSDIGASLPIGYDCGVAWGDFDRDGDLDLITVGSYYDTSFHTLSRIYRNDGNTFNTAPSAPTGLSAVAAGGDVTFSWDAATDAQTPANGLSYNLRVGTTPGSNNVFSGMASASGSRKLLANGNAQKRLSWSVTGLKLPTYYWSVQAIDTAFAGSPWAPEQTCARADNQLKMKHDDTTVAWDLAPVTVALDDSFYIEDPARSTGIRVQKTGHSLMPGKRASVYGTIKTNDDGERYILATAATPSGNGSVGPLAMSNWIVGGKDASYDPFEKTGQQGVKDATSLGNIGLLVVTLGTITQIGSDYIYIDDGSGLKDGTLTGTEQNIGVRVMCYPSGYSGGDYVCVTGASSCFRLSPTELARRVWAAQVTKLR